MRPLPGVREATGSKETLDDFYFWGEMLISDFDDADKEPGRYGRFVQQPQGSERPGR